jgi:PhnB protein
MAKTVKKKAKMLKKTARNTAKAKVVAASAKTANKKPARQKASRKIDPLNRTQYRSVTPMLAISDMKQAIDFYTTAFGFKKKSVMETPRGIMHAELTLRDMTLMLSPESQEGNNPSAHSLGNTPVTLYILVEDADKTFGSAVAAGGTAMMPVSDMFWGDRCGMVTDPEGNKWMIATHKSEPTEAEMQAAMRQMMEQSQQAAASAGS